MSTTPTRNQAQELLHMTLPMLLGVISLMSFQMIDSIFIGQLGVEPLAAVGFSIPIYQAIIGIQVGLGIATTAIISQAIGRGEHRQAANTGGLVIVTGAILIALLCTLLWLARYPLLEKLGATPDVIPAIESYWSVFLGGAWVGAMVYFGYSLSRAHGNTKLPGKVMVLTSLINIALDPLFIFVFDLGLIGAAYASLAAFLCGGVLIYPRLFKENWLHFDFANIPVVKALKSLFGIMAPAMVSQLLPAISATLATGLVAVYGATAVAAWGLGTRLEFFSIVAVLALTMALPQMVGRYLGEGNLPAIRSIMKIAVRFIILWQIAIALLWLLLSSWASGTFTNDTAVGLLLEDYILRLPISYAPLGVCIIVVSICNALSMPMRALLVSALRLFACYLPFLWTGAQIAGLQGLMNGAMLGNILAGIVAWQFYTAGMKQLDQQHNNTT